MQKYYYSSIIILIIYYISTFIISFSLLSNGVVKNDHIKLSRFIIDYDLKDNFKKDLNQFTSSLPNSLKKNFSIKNKNIEFSGELSSNFFKKIINRVSKNISNDFSNPKIILFFYFNSNKISEYLNKSFLNLGYYDFQKFMRELKKNNSQKQKTSIVAANNNQKINIRNTINKLIRRISSADYFFLSSPIHFKIKATHQDIPFEVILKFNGYIWKIQKITLPYKKLINLQKLS